MGRTELAGLFQPGAANPATRRRAVRGGFVGRGFVVQFGREPRASRLRGRDGAPTRRCGVGRPADAVGGAPAPLHGDGAARRVQTAATTNGTAAAGLVAQCEDTIANPNDYTTRGGSDGNYWPGAAVACAFAYVATGTAAVPHAGDQVLAGVARRRSDHRRRKGCIAGVSTNWQTWGSGERPGAARHPHGHARHRLSDALVRAGHRAHLRLALRRAGRRRALVTQTRTCLTAWIDYYTGYGYHHDEAGANYNAGYVIGKALGAIAIGNDGGADGHLWTQDARRRLRHAPRRDGLAGASSAPRGRDGRRRLGRGLAVRTAQRARVRAATRALEAHGARSPRWTSGPDELALRYIYAVTPTGKFDLRQRRLRLTTPNLDRRTSTSSTPCSPAPRATRPRRGPRS